MKSSNNNNNNQKQVKMKSKEIKKRIEALEQAVGEVVFTERRFVFNQLFMQYIRLNDINSQGSTYEEIYPNIHKHFTDFESISKGYRANKFESFTDEVSDYLIDCVRAKELTDTELHALEDRNFLEECLGNFENEQDFKFNQMLRDLGREYRRRNQ